VAYDAVMNNVHKNKQSKKSLLKKLSGRIIRVKTSTLYMATKRNFGITVTINFIERSKSCEIVKN
jgi:hypothetical protein